MINQKFISMFFNVKQYASSKHKISCNYIASIPQHQTCSLWDNFYVQHRRTFKNDLSKDIFFIVVFLILLDFLHKLYFCILNKSCIIRQYAPFIFDWNILNLMPNVGTSVALKFKSWRIIKNLKRQFIIDKALLIHFS